MAVENKKKFRYLKWFLTSVILLSIIAIFSGYVLLRYYLDDLPDFQTEVLGSLSATSFIYDRNEQLVTTLHGEENRIPITLDQVPDVMKNAIIAAEDVRFFEHQGLDLRAITRALLTNIQESRYAEGASTITQQLVKNTFLTADKTIKRKVHEAFLAHQLESKLTKEEILELYLNRIYFGHGAYGIQAAAQTFFGKDASQLSLAEAATLAALPRSPSDYSPINRNEPCKDRRNLILGLMHKNGFINEVQWRQSISAPLDAEYHHHQGSYPYPAFVDHVINELTAFHGLTENQIFRGGLKIYTTLDPKIQLSIEGALTDENNYPASKGEQPVQAAMAVIDHNTGEIIGLGGGKSYQGKREFNRATQLRRQPGSTLKPIVVFAPAMEKGYSPEDILLDEPIDIKGYKPENYDKRFRGPVTIREAVINSINIPAVVLLNKIGVDTGITFAKNIGLPLEKEDRYLSMALGGMTKGLAPLHLASAYGALANLGTYNQPHSVNRIIAADGTDLAKKTEPKQVINAMAAYRTTEMLISTVNTGTAFRARLKHPTAGKTGTTELPQEVDFSNLRGNKDAWFVGYTPYLTAAVWMGYDHTDRNHYLNQVYGGSLPAKIFRTVLSQALEDKPIKQFARPANYFPPPSGKFLGNPDSPYAGIYASKPENTVDSLDEEANIYNSDNNFNKQLTQPNTAFIPSPRINLGAPTSEPQSTPSTRDQLPDNN